MPVTYLPVTLDGQVQVNFEYIENFGVFMDPRPGVNITPAVGQGLEWNGVGWVPEAPTKFAPIRYYRASAYSVASAAWTVLPVDTLDYDKSGGAYTFTSNHVVVPVAGTYQVIVQMMIQNATSGNSLSVSAFYNGGRTGDQGFGTSSAFNQISAISVGILNCAAGDTLGAGYYCSVAGASGFLDSKNNAFTVMRVA